MKMHCEIDCTPDEARQFLGLPDVKPMQEAVMAKLQSQMLEAAERFSPDAQLKSWLSLSPYSPEQMREWMENFTRSALAMATGTKTP